MVVSPYLRFNGNAQEAFDFYKNVLGGELSITKVGDSPMAQFMPEKKDIIFHAQLKNEKVILLGSDLTPDEGLTKGNMMVLTLECSSREEADSMLQKLSEGGKIGHPLNEMGNVTIGDLQDKFGVDWFIVWMKEGGNA